MKKPAKNTYAGKPISQATNHGFKKNKRKQLGQFTK